MHMSNGFAAVQVLGWRGKIVGLLLAWLALGGATAMAAAGTFTPGDGSGKIRNFWPLVNLGSVILVR